MTATTQEQLQKAKTLAEALPYMKQFSGEVFVIKFGGSAMGSRELMQNFARDVVLLKQVGINPIIVHGGGPQISQMLEKLKIRSSFVDGLRVTDKETVEIVEMVLCGSINKQIVTEINLAGGFAVGLSGKDGNLISAEKISRKKSDPDSNIEQILDLGFVGEPTKVNPHILKIFENSDIIPVVAPIGRGDDGETYNINADSAAGAIASAVTARKLIMLSDVPGVLDKDGKLISKASVATIKKMISNKVITGGMIPKVETCLDAIKHHSEVVHILDGRVPHVLLLELFTDHGSGTMIVP